MSCAGEVGEVTGQERSEENVDRPRAEANPTANCSKHHPVRASNAHFVHPATTEAARVLAWAEDACEDAMALDASTEERVVVTLRPVETADLDILFEHQLDPEAVRMAAFTNEDPTDRATFDRHWQRLLDDEQVIVRAILSDGEVVGHIAVFGPDDQREVTYWIGRDHWGQGSATQALRQMLGLVEQRPLFARAAADNVGSLIVLKNSGFEEIRREQGYANARDGEIEEVVLTLLP